MSSVPTNNYEKIKQELPAEIKQNERLATLYLALNNAKGATSDVRVRKALAYGIKRDILVHQVLKLGQIPAYNFVPGVTANYTPPKIAWGRWDQAKREQRAKELLHEAGYSESNPLKIEMLFPTNPGNKLMFVAIGSMWRQLFGKAIKVNYLNQEWKSFLSSEQEGNFQVAFGNWSADYNDPSTFLDLLQSSNSINVMKFDNSHYDALVTKADQTQNGKDRLNFYHQAEQILANEMPIIPLYYMVGIRLVKPYVGGYYESPLDRIYSKDLYIRTAEAK